MATLRQENPLAYASWRAMRRRCENSDQAGWDNYGGRGITVCEAWLDFAVFLADLGERPSRRHSLERRNNELGYEPGNCYWATGSEQARNRKPPRRHNPTGFNISDRATPPSNVRWQDTDTETPWPIPYITYL